MIAITAIPLFLLGTFVIFLFFLSMALGVFALMAQEGYTFTKPPKKINHKGRK